MGIMLLSAAVRSQLQELKLEEELRSCTPSERIPPLTAALTPRPPQTHTHTHLHTFTAATLPMQRDASGEAVTTVRFENLTFPDITTPITIRHFLSVLGEALSSPVSDGS